MNDRVRMRHASAYTASSWPTIESKVTGRTVIDGTEVVMFSSNDYLGLSSHPAVLARAREALDDFGTGSGMNPGRGLTRVHRELAQALAEFLGTEDVLLFNSCTAANCALIATMIGENEVVFSDELNHASIIDGCRLARGRTVVYGHCDMESLRAALAAAGRAPLRMVVSDGVFSMEAELVPLKELLDVANENGATVVLDESHAVGVVGGTGRGSAELYGVDPSSFVQTGTFSKALAGGIGGYVAGPTALTDRLRRHARFFIFTSPMPPVSAAAALAALEVLRTTPELPALAKSNATELRRSLRDLGFTVGGSEQHPSTPVLVGDSMTASCLSRALLERGVFAPAVVYPVVPEGHARLRLQVSAAHTADDIAKAVEAFGDARTEMAAPSKSRA